MDKKIAIVTGGASGIGKAICKELISQQVHVYLADINAGDGKRVERDLGDLATFVHLDVTDAAQVTQTYYDIYNKHGRLDYVFNNAGIAMYGELHHMTLDQWKDIMNINVWGVIHGTQAAYDIMKKQGHGYLVNTASAAGLGSGPITSAYATSKHAIVGLTTSLHYEAEAYGIHVSALCPAFVDTPIFERAHAIQIDKNHILNQLKNQKLMSPETIAKKAITGVHKNKVIVSSIPLRRPLDIFFILFPPAHRALMRMVCKVSRNANTR